jgi:acyl-homoserine-lactone acylase
MPVSIIASIFSSIRPTLARAALTPLLGLLALASASNAFAAYRPTHGSEILWDRYGVAHVYAKSVTDLFYCFGWAMAHSHGDILAKLYAQARGRAAEYYGAEELKSDRWMAINGVPARAQLWLREQSPAFRANLEAFAAGINAYASAHPDALSEQARRVFPVSATDVVAYEQRLFQFTYAAPASLADRLTPTPVAAPGAPAAGSNGWAIAPSRSASDRAMLLMNPHLPWAPGWSTYYEIQLTAPGVDLYGATQVGLPVLRFVFSDYLGFTHTVNDPPAVTFYRIAAVPGGYRFDGKVQPFRTRRQTLRIRQPDGSFTTETATVRSTVQGPIVGERDGAPIAMRVAGLDRPYALEQYWHMAIAHDFAGFQGAVAQLQVPTFNILYADRDGHIEYLYNALVPRHLTGDLNYWSSIVAGDTSKTLWTDYLRFDELPKVIDPPGGTVENSNDPPWDAAWPNVLDPAPFSAVIPPVPTPSVVLRAERGIHMLSEDSKISFDQLIADKWSHHCELADRVLPELLEATVRYGDDLAKRAAEVLAHWDRSTNADSRGALLFLDWAQRPGAASGFEPEGFAHPIDIYRPLTTPSGLADPEGAVRALQAAAQDMLAGFGALDTPWGQVMRLKIDSVDLPASGGPARLGVFDVLDYSPLNNGTRAANFGGSYVAVVSFDRPTRAKVLLSYGTSSQPGSAHRSDQLPLLSKGVLRDAWRTRAEVEANLESRDSF